MNWLLLLALSQTAAPAPGTAAQPVPHQAMLEYRILELEPAGRTPRRMSLSVYQLNTIDLDRALQRLETLDGEGDTDDRIGIPGVGLFRGGRVISSPRVLVQESQRASIEYGARTAGRPGESGSVIDRQFDSGALVAEGGDPFSRPTLLLESEYEMEDGLARLQIDVTHYDDGLTDHWQGEVLLAPDETGVVRINRHPEGGVFAVTVTFRPLTRD